MSQYKYPEFILAIARDTFRQINLQEGMNRNFSFEEFLDLVQTDLTIRQRNHLDESRHWGESHKGDRNYSQWLNYFVVENADGTINPYMRSREGSGESDLQGRGSIGVGGHTDFDDIHSHSSVINSRSTVLYNVMREFFEECTVYVDGVKFQAFKNEGTPQERLIATVQHLAEFAELFFEGVLFDNSDPVGRLHFAMALRLKLKEGITIGNREKALDFITPVRVQDLGDTYPNVTFENWSKEFAFILSSAELQSSKYNLLRYLPGHVV